VILSDKQIKGAVELGDITITPFDLERLGSNSYDVLLGNTIAQYEKPVLDAREENPVKYYEVSDKGFLLRPGEFYLGVTHEVIGSRRYVPFMDGKSSVGRLGILVHVTAGRGDVGFINHWTMEIATFKPVIVYPGMPIGQFTFYDTGPVVVPYDIKVSAKYNERSARPVPSMMWKNFKKK